MSKYADPDLLTTTLRYRVDISKRTKNFRLILYFNGIVGFIFSILGMIFPSSSLYLIIAIFLFVSITFTTTLGILDYRRDQKYFRTFIVISSVLSLITLLISAEVLISVNVYLMGVVTIAIGICEFIFLCYNFVIGQKEDRNLLLGKRIEDAKRQKRREYIDNK